jgi:hypothetical protein
MGWLEVLAMLKRLLPLLTRVAPMLESYVGGRVAGRDDAALLERVAGEFKTELIATTAVHRTETQAALAEQAAELRDIRMELKHLREEQAARIAEADLRNASMQQSIRALGIVTMVMVAVCIALLVVIFLRH